MIDHEFYNFQELISKYKSSIIRNLDKVDETIGLAVASYEKTHVKAARLEKLNTSLEMVKVLKRYVNLLYLSESVLDDLVSQVLDNQLDSLPVREFDLCNRLGNLLEAESSVGSSDLSSETVVGISPISSRQKESSKPTRLAEDSGTTAFLVKPDLPQQSESNERVTEQIIPESLQTFASKSPTVDSILLQSELSTDNSAYIQRDILRDQEGDIPQNEDLNILGSSPRVAAEKSTDYSIVTEDESFKEPTYPETIDLVETIDHNDETDAIKNAQPTELIPFKVKESKICSNPFLTPFDDTVTVHSEDPAPASNKKSHLIPPQVENRISGSKLRSGKSSREAVSQAKDSSKFQEDSAVKKLTSMPIHNRRLEAEKQLKPERPIKLYWKAAHPGKTTDLSKPEKKSNDYPILEDVLYVGVSCNFAHVANPSEFYVRINQSLFEELDTKLNDQLNGRYGFIVNYCKSKLEARALVGNFCFVFLLGKRKWFRAEVLDWLMNEKCKVLIKLVDYGECSYTSFEYFKPMTEVCASFPRMATKCHLAAIRSPSGSDSKSWPSASVDTLRELSEMKDLTRFQVIYAQKEGDSFAVDLIKEGTDTSLGTILTEKKLAVYLALESIEEEDDDLECFDNINEAIAGYDARDEARICKFSDSSGRCFKGARCRLEHGQLSEDGVTTDKMLVVNEPYEQIALPKPGSCVKILITGYINTCHFYAHIITDRSTENIYNDSLHNLQRAMCTNNVVQQYLPFKMFPGLGELLLVKHESEWCRGRCVSYSSNDLVKVFLVDFGFHVEKNLSDLRQMYDDFLHLPFQAVECMLSDCQERFDISTEKSMEFFNNCMILKNFEATVIDVVNDSVRLKLWEGNGMDMSYVLGTFGLIQPRTEDILTPKNLILQLA